LHSFFKVKRDLALIKATATAGDDMHGEGTFTFSNGEKYQGNCHKGRRDGFGVFSYSDGSTFSGEWRSNKRHGPGKMTCPFGKRSYEGVWANDMKSISLYIDGGLVPCSHASWYPKN
jgi:hypothetical protein